MDTKKLDLCTELLSWNSYIESFQDIQKFMEQNEELSQISDYASSRFQNELLLGLQESRKIWSELLNENRNLKVDEARLQYNQKMLEHHTYMNGKNVPVPTVTIVEQIKQVVERTPDKIALIDEYGVVTYQVFWNRVNSVAAYLLSQGIEKDDVIGLEVDNSIETVVKMTAIMLIGAIYMPFDKKIPLERKQYMVTNASAKVIYSKSELVVDGVKNIFYVSDPGYTERVVIKQSSSSYCYIVFTSGTTGKPKGVKVGEYQLRNLLNWYKEEMKIDEDTRMIALHSFVFDTNFKNVFTPLVSGATSVINLENEYDFYRVASYIGENRCTHLKCNASVFEAVLAAEKENQYSNLADLQFLFLGGDKFTGEDLYNFWHQHEKELVIFNAYGPTEATDTSSCHRLVSEELENLKSTNVPIGIPVYNQDIVVVSSNGYICPPGIKGEIYIGGIGVTEGYVNQDADQSLEVFRKSFILEDKTFYKSGDYGMWNSNKELLFMGREDDMVKLHGYRIYLSEIENVILQIPHVSHCKVLVVSENIIAFYQTEENEELNSIVAQECAKYLSSFMIPQKFVHLEAFPYTVNGKVDRKQLELMLDKREDEQETTQFSGVQEKVFEIWKGILKKENFGIRDNFFDLGGNSLNLFMLSKKIDKEYSVRIRPLEFMENSTIEKIADLILSRKK